MKRTFDPPPKSVTIHTEKRDHTTMTTYTSPEKNGQRARILSTCENVKGYIVYLDNEFAEFTKFATMRWGMKKNRLKPVTDQAWKADEIYRQTGVKAVAQDINDFVLTLKPASCAYIWFDFCGTTIRHSSFNAAARAVKYGGGIAITLSVRCNGEEQDSFIIKGFKSINYACDPPIQYYGCSGIRNMKIWFSFPKKQIIGLKGLKELDTNVKPISRKRKIEFIEEDNEDKENYPRPRGRAPNGCMWNDSTGVWDTLEETEISVENYPRPRGRAPNGCMWNDSTGVWDRLEETEVSVENYPRPRGRAPNGYVWNNSAGVWTEDDTNKKLAKKHTKKHAKKHTKIAKKRKVEQEFATFTLYGSKYLASVKGPSFYDKSAIDMIVVSVNSDKNHPKCGKPVTRKATDLVKM